MSNRVSENALKTGSLYQFPHNNEFGNEHENYLLSGTKTINLEGDYVENDKILEKYIEKVDRDQSDLRNDIRESERRTQEHIDKIEEKMDARLNRIENLISIQNDNLDKKINSINNKIENQKDSINSKLDNLNNIMIDKIDSTNKWIMGIAISTIIGIAAMVLTVLLK